MSETGILTRLRHLSSGEIAALRRMAGKPLSEADGSALEAMFKLLPGDAKASDHAKWMAVFSLICLWHPEQASLAGSMAEMMRRYKLKHETGGMDAKMRMMLDSRWDEDGFFVSKMARIARMLRAENRLAMPDPDRLFADLKAWNYDKRTVQIRWAEEYYLKENERNAD